MKLISCAELRLCYQVKNCGTDFRWNMFGMTNKDGDNISSGLKSCRKLRRICIRNSLMNDDNLYALCDGLRNSTKLTTLLVPNNCLVTEQPNILPLSNSLLFLQTDEAIPVLVKFMATHSLKRIDLSNNRLTCEGVIMLAKSLEIGGANGQLKRLNLSLNNIGRAGCHALCQVILVRFVVWFFNFHDE